MTFELHTPARVGVIGCGRVAWLLENDERRSKPCSHVGGWLKQPGIQLQAACDIDTQRLSDFGEHYGVESRYTDYRAMLAGEQLDYVSIAAYATERADMVCAAAEAGVKGIWCEKAAAVSLAEIERMQAALERHNTRLIVSYMRRWELRYHKVNELIRAGAIGELQTINVHFSGNMLHTGTHAFDLLRLYAGEAVAVQAWLETGEEQNVQSGYRYDARTDFCDFGGDALIHFDSGVTAMIHGRDKDYFRFEFELLGSAGMIRIGNVQTELWTPADATYMSVMQELKRVDFPKFEYGNNWSAAAADLVSAVRQGTSVACGIDDARAALAIGLAMHQSQEQQHAVIDVADVRRDLIVPSR